MQAVTAPWRDYQTYAAGRAHSVVGTLYVQTDVWSPQLENQRDILVYVPPSYATSNRRYPVLYMLDGQNLFDATTSYVGEWRVDETMEVLGAEGIEAIVVGIPNMGDQRIHEYSPFNDVRTGAGRGDHYIAFLVETIKPLIDASFRTLPERRYTGVMGSSLGGLISLYAFFTRGDIFGLAGVMSPSLWLANEAIFPVVQHAPFVPGKVYLDVGTLEGGGRMHTSAERMARLLTRKGYRRGSDLRYVVEQGGVHNESAWAARLPDALRFLLK